MKKKLTTPPAPRIIRTTEAPIVRRMSTLGVLSGETEHSAGSCTVSLRLSSVAFTFVGADEQPDALTKERSLEIGFANVLTCMSALRDLSLVAGDLADRMARANALPRRLERDE